MSSNHLDPGSVGGLRNELRRFLSGSKSRSRSRSRSRSKPAARSVKSDEESLSHSLSGNPQAPTASASQLDASMSGASKPTQSKIDASSPESLVRASNHQEPNAVALPTTQARDLSREALNALPDDLRAEIDKLSPGDAKSTPVADHIHAMVTLVETKEAQCKEKFWKIHVNGHDVVLRDYVKDSFVFLQQVGDIAIQFAPSPGPLVWPVMKNLIKIYVDGEAELCALLMIAKKITPVIGRNQIYEQQFNEKNTPKEQLEMFHSTLLAIYSACYELLAHASKELSSKLRRAAHAILSPGAATEMIANLKALEGDLDRNVQLCHTIRTAASNERAEMELQKLKQLLDSSEQTLQSIDRGVSRLLESDDQETLDWISKVQYTDHHEGIKEARTEGTGTWLLKHIDKWEAKDSSALLWLHGSVGTGKTYLTSRVIDHVQESFESSPEDGGFAFFYCLKQDPDRSQPVSILRSFVRQLSTTYRAEDEMRQQLRSACKRDQKKGGHFSLQTCKDQLFESVNLYPRTILILDALDECGRETRKQLMDVIGQLLLESKRPLKVFIASRPDQDIHRRYSSGPNLDVDDSANIGDIKTYIRGKIQNFDNWTDVSEKTKDKVTRTLADRGAGMFRWVQLQFQNLFQYANDDDIESQLGKLPKDLDDSYDQIYSRIKSRGDIDRAHAERALKWVMCAAKPLSSEELLAAICLPVDITGNVDNKVSESTLLELCQNLLVIDPRLNIWKFSHLSVAEYLEKHHWTLPGAHCYAAKVCLSQLLITYTHFEVGAVIVGKAAGPVNQDNNPVLSALHDTCRPNHEIQQYVRWHWHIHVRVQEDQAADPDLILLLKTFLKHPMDSSMQYRRWITHLKQHPSSIDTVLLVDLLEPENIALFAMCRFSFFTHLKDWWYASDKATIDFSVRTKEGVNLLALASSVEMCKILIRDVDVNEFVPGYGSALAAAIELSDMDVVTFLVQEGGADVNIRFLDPSWGMTYGSALAAAAGTDDLKVVKFLVEIGKADVDLLLATGFFGSALISAVETAGADVVRYLVVEAKANVHLRMQDPFHGHSAIEAAIFLRSDIEIIKILVLEGGADVNMQIQNEYGSILSYAVYFSSRVSDIAVFLVQDGGADINMQIENGRYGSALAVAASSQSTEKVQAMIGLGADANMQIRHGPYGSALAVAAAFSPANLKILLNAGAMVDMQIENGWTYTGSALATAVLAGIPSSTKRLLKLGANVNMQIKHGPYGSALAAAAAAASSCSLKSVEILVKAGANINMPLENGEHKSALEAAAAYANINVLEYLIQAGADVGISGARALQAVRGTLKDEKTKETAVKLLLEAGAKDVTEEQLSAGVSGVSTSM